MKVLLLDTSFAAAPIHDWLKEAGHDVWTMGNRASDLLAVRSGDKWINQDYSDVAAVRAHIERLDIRYVVPGCTDVSIDACIRLGVGPQIFDAPETNRLLTNKAAFRRVCEDIGVPSPRVVARERFPLQGKFICKPVDAFSGRGVTVFDGADPAGLDAACQLAEQASPTREILIETFADGQLHSCSAIIEKQRIVDRFYVLEGSSANPFVVDTSHVVYDFPVRYAEILERSVERLCATLGLKDGLLHTQFILTNEGAVVIEVTRRCPGDLYSLLIEYSTGYRYAAKYASYFVETRCNTEARHHKYMLRHTLTTDQQVVGGLVFRSPTPVVAHVPLYGVGLRLESARATRVGLLFCEATTPAELREIYELFLARKAYCFT